MPVSHDRYAEVSISQAALQALATCRGNPLFVSVDFAAKRVAMMTLMMFQGHWIVRQFKEAWKGIELGQWKRSNLRKADFKAKYRYLKNRLYTLRGILCHAPVVLSVLFGHNLQTPKRWLYVKVLCSSCPDSNPLWGCLYISPIIKMRAAACCTPVWLRLIASVKRAPWWSPRPSLSTFKLPAPIAHICFGMCLSGELLISWARSRHSLNVRCKYSPVSCRVCLINMAEVPPGRLR